MLNLFDYVHLKLISIISNQPPLSTIQLIDGSYSLFPRVSGRVKGLVSSGLGLDKVNGFEFSE